MSWWNKRRRDKFQDNADNSIGDSIDDFSEQGNVRFSGSPKDVKFIMKDETNFKTCRKLGSKIW